MKRILFSYLIFSFILLSFDLISAQEKNPENKYSKIVPNYTELNHLHSELINDDFFIYVKLPKGYKDNAESYPVIYLLDGDIAFTMAWSTIRYLQFGRHLPDVIIVGIGYGALLSSEEQNMRERDYTISELERWEGSGGGIKFVEFLETELIPFVDSKYRTDPNRRVLNGFSLGGLVTLYTYLNKNYLFSGYVAGSPYISSDIDYLIELVKKNSNMLVNSNKKIFISYGELEDSERYGAPIKKIVKLLDSNNIDGVKLRVFENGTHFTCPSEAMVYGLRYIFE